MPLKSHRSGFTLVEMPTVPSIIAIMTGLDVAAFRGQGQVTAGIMSILVLFGVSFTAVRGNSLHKGANAIAITTQAGGWLAHKNIRLLPEALN